MPPETPIKVGLMCTCSGPFGANTSTAADVFKAWVDATNAAGGVEGHSIQLTAEDDGGVPGTALTDLQKLISSGVDAIVNNSLVDDTWATEAQSSNIPVVGMDLSSDTFYKYPDFYPEGQTADSATYAVASVAKDAGVTMVGTLYCVESASCAQQAEQFKAAAQKFGVTQNYSASISGTAPNYTAQCLAAKQDKVQGLFILDGADQIVNVAADCSKQGYNPTYLQEGLGFQMILTHVAGRERRPVERNERSPVLRQLGKRPSDECGGRQVLPGYPTEGEPVERAVRDGLDLRTAP